MRLVPSRSTRRITPLKVMLLLAMLFAPEFAAAGNPRDPELVLPASHWEMVAGAVASGGCWWLTAGDDERMNKGRRLKQTLDGDIRNMYRPIDPTSAERRIVTGAAAFAAVGTAASRGDTAPNASATAAAASAAAATAAAASSVPATAATAAGPSPSHRTERRMDRGAGGSWHCP